MRKLSNFKTQNIEQWKYLHYTLHAQESSSRYSYTIDLSNYSKQVYVTNLRKNSH